MSEKVILIISVVIGTSIFLSIAMICFTTYKMMSKSLDVRDIKRKDRQSKMAELRNDFAYHYSKSTKTYEPKKSELRNKHD